MKKILLLSSLLFAVTLFFPAFCQENTAGRDSVSKKETSSPKSKNMSSPANASQEQPGTKQNSQNAGTSKSGNPPRQKSKREHTSTPPVDNKIAVSDPGMPAEKPTKKEKAKSNAAGKNESAPAISPK